MKSFAVFSLIALLAAVSPAGAQTELTFSSWVPRTHPINAYIFEPWAAQVEKATDRKLRIRFLPKPIAAPNQHYDSLVSGQVDLAYSVYAYQPERFLPYLIGELPFLGDSAVATSVALWRTHTAHIAKAGLHKDVHLLGVMTTGPGMIHHARKHVLAPDDLKGSKIRAGGDVASAIVQQLGGVVVTQPATKTYELLSSGIVDGTMLQMDALKGFNLARLVPYTTRVPGGLFAGAFWFAVNKAKWESLSEEQRQAIERTAGESFARLAGAGWDRADREGLEEAKSNNNRIADAPAAVVEQVKAATAKLEAEYAAKMTAFGLDGKAVIQSFRAAVASGK
jgi:TRAP-type C4-dicarboxylate transport system substrate-binding protein